jgi:hypothetical protein
MCHAVRYETTGEPIGVFHCHCQSCRKHNGASVATLAVFKSDQVKFSGDERKNFESTPNVGRAFCAKCGTPLTWETAFGDLGMLCSIHISTFDNPDTLTPTAHTFYSERISWFDIADDLPRYEGFAADGSLLHHGPAKERPSG